MSLVPVAPPEIVRSYGEPDRAAPQGCVSVVVSLYNYEAFILESLDSVAAQTHADLDLIVVDDASTDTGAVRVATWIDRHHARFRSARLLRHRRNRGLSATRNTAFAAARTEPVFVLDADNLLYPTAIAKLAALMARTGAAVTYAQIAIFGQQAHVGNASEWDRERFREGNYVDAMALVRRSAWAQVGGYDALDLGWEDFDLWLKILEQDLRGVFLPEILCRYRVHGDSMLRTLTDTERRKQRVRAQLAHRHPWLELRP